MATENRYLNRAQPPEYNIVMGLYPNTTPVVIREEATKGPHFRQVCDKVYCHRPRRARWMKKIATPIKMVTTTTAGTML